VSTIKSGAKQKLYDKPSDSCSTTTQHGSSSALSFESRSVIE